MGDMGFSGPMANNDVWQELLDNEELIRSQNDILAGRLPESYNEVVLIVNEDNTVSDFTLYALGLRDHEELASMFAKMQRGEDIEALESVSYTFEEILELEFKLILNTDYFVRENNIWIDKRNNPEFMNNLFENAERIQVVGIIRPNEESVSTAMSAGVIGYTSELKRHVIERVNYSEIAIEQKETPEINIFTGLNFPSETEINAGFDYSRLTSEQRAHMAGLSDEERANLISAFAQNANNTLENNLRMLGVVDLSKPQSIRIFPVNFEGKENISNAIEEYNQRMTDEGKEEYVISYTDIVGLMMRSVTSIINMVSYVLIAFVAISLVVSSIMIGIITYISVLERTKEIGILRSIGASKKDISRVFNAETFIVGVASGLIGIGVTLILTIPANIIIRNLTGVSGIAQLPVIGAVTLIIISMLLTMVAGIIPAKMASKKDPVVALRTD